MYRFIIVKQNSKNYLKPSLELFSAPLKRSKDRGVHHLLHNIHTESMSLPLWLRWVPGWKEGPIPQPSSWVKKLSPWQLFGYELSQDLKCMKFATVPKEDSLSVELPVLAETPTVASLNICLLLVQEIGNTQRSFSDPIPYQGTRC